MAENKTKPTDDDVDAFLDRTLSGERRDEARTLCLLMEEITGDKPVLWGGSMVGFGRYRYKYQSGREGEWMATGFAPRAKEFVVYLLTDPPDREQLLSRLGKHRIGKSCLYIRRMPDIDLAVLRALVQSSLRALRELHPSA